MKSRLTLAGIFIVATIACSPPPPPPSTTTTTTTTTSSSTPAATPAPAEAPAMNMAPPTTDEGMIQSAMSAAPQSIAKDASVITMEEKDGKMTTRELRKGTNGWTCIPDTPQSPGLDPMCVDQNGAAWAMAWLNHTAPPKGKMGFGYMLMGGSDASNTDPFLMKAAGDKWVDTGPHVMILNIGDSFAGYPTTADNTKVPYIMFPGTPYAHLMIPVK